MHHEHHEGHCCHPHQPKAGILLAMFGTTIVKARGGYDVLEAAINERFPGIPVFRSYTADKIRRKMKRQGETAYSVGQALMEMYDAGFTHVAVQSVHTVPGVEFDWTRQQALALEHPRKGFKKITIGDPLITELTLDKVTAGVPEYLPDTIPADEGVILVGHGTYHPAQVYYHALQAGLAEINSKWVVGTLMGAGLGVDEVLTKIQARGLHKVHLVPFMGVAGHHYMEDIAGESDSWKAVFAEHGIECVCHEEGTAGSAVYMPIWLNHLHVALHGLGEEFSDLVPPLPPQPERGHTHSHHHHHHEEEKHHDECECHAEHHEHD